MSEFGGLRKHKNTQHALVGLGSAALAAAVALLTQVRRPQFPERDNKVYSIHVVVVYRYACMHWLRRKK